MCSRFCFDDYHLLHHQVFCLFFYMLLLSVIEYKTVSIRF